jgi:hypothetical protein
MAKKKTLSEYQAAFKNLLREMEQDFGTPCNGVYLRVQVTTDLVNRDSINAYDVPKRTEKREVTCEISFGDSYSLKLV